MPLQGEFGGGRIERAAIMKAHAALQMEHDRQAVSADSQEERELGQHRAIGGELHQPFIDIAVKNFRDRRRRVGRGIENRRLELRADR